MGWECSPRRGAAFASEEEENVTQRTRRSGERREHRESRATSVIKFSWLTVRRCDLGSNWSFLISRTIIFAAILFLLYLSQRFWFVRAWRLTRRVPPTRLCWMLRSAWMAAGLGIGLAIF